MARAHPGDATLPSILVSFIFLQLLTSGNGKSDFLVLGPPHPLLAIVGQDKELPCKLSLNISAEGMELRWYRDKPSSVVHVYKNGEDVYDEQMAEYKGRTSFNGSHVARGEATVKIHNITVFDNGTYHCVFKEYTSHSQATLWLKVAGRGSSPRIRVTDTQDKGIRAECTSAGWYPEPKVEWLDLKGQPVSAESHFSVSASTGLMALLSIVTPQDTAVGGLTCSISNPLLPEKVTETYLLASLSRRPLSTESGPALPLILTALGLVSAAIACAFGKCHKEQHKTNQEEADPGARDEAGLFHVSLSLDPETASPKLMVSEDQKSVKRLLFDQDVYPSSRRFNQDPCILAQERFEAGRHYWEVEVGDRRAWILGVCLESLVREGRIPKSPQHGLWALEFYKKKLQALSYPRTCLSPPEPLRRVGILLDFEAGQISFYNSTNGSLIYVFSGFSFSGPLQPFFCLWTHDPRPLTICSMVTETKEDTESSGDPGLPGDS